MTKLPYVTFMKHAQKVTKNASAGRPILKGVIHREDYIAVTDSHRLYYAADMYEGEEKNVNPVTGAEIVEGTYPDVMRLLPENGSAKATAKIRVDITARALKIIEQAGKVGKKTDFITIESNGEELKFSTYVNAHVYAEYISELPAEGETFVMLASAKYLAEAFALMKDAGFTEVMFNFYGDKRPFTFTGGNLTILILPVPIN